VANNLATYPGEGNETPWVTFADGRPTVASKQREELEMYSNDVEIVGAIRRPIQCEGIERGPKRMAEVAVSGAVNPQIDWGSVLGGVAQALPGVLGAFGI
jgi:hypothetical protein